jgi:hypothetical protein
VDRRQPGAPWAGWRAVATAYRAPTRRRPLSPRMVGVRPAGARAAVIAFAEGPQLRVAAHATPFWRRRTNVWRRITSPPRGAKRLNRRARRTADGEAGGLEGPTSGDIKLNLKTERQWQPSIQAVIGRSRGWPCNSKGAARMSTFAAGALTDRIDYWIRRRVLQYSDDTHPSQRQL